MLSDVNARKKTYQSVLTTVAHWPQAEQVRLIYDISSLLKATLTEEASMTHQEVSLAALHQAYSDKKPTALRQYRANEAVGLIHYGGSLPSVADEEALLTDEIVRKYG